MKLGINTGVKGLWFKFNKQTRDIPNQERYSGQGEQLMSQTNEDVPI